MNDETTPKHLMLSDDAVDALWFAVDSEVALTGGRMPKQCDHRVFCEHLISWLDDAGYAIVPVSPVRADREAVVEAGEILDWVIGVASWENADAHDALLRLRSVLDALRATPEPERAE